MIRSESAIGKPFVVKVDGETRQIGTVTHAATRDGKLYFAVDPALDTSPDETTPEVKPEDNSGVA